MYEFSADWVTPRTKQWQELFADLAGKPNARMLEVGCWEGRSAVWFLENVLTHESSSLICVDPWRTTPHQERTFDKNIVLTGQSHRVRKQKACSRKALGWLPDEHFDAIYVDGSHEACDVLLDALLCVHLVKPGGIILFDDYRWQNPEGHRRQLPKPALDAFLSLCDWRVEAIHVGYQLAVRKRETPLKPQECAPSYSS